RLLAGGVITRPVARSLVSPSCLAQRRASRLAPAAHAAVPIATITARAQEEHLAALGSGADDEAQRVHDGAAAPKNWTLFSKPCDVRATDFHVSVQRFSEQRARSVPLRALAILGFSGSDFVPRPATVRDFSACPGPPFRFTR